MLRYLAISLVLVPCLLSAQDQSKLQKERTKALDVAATTPFFTKRGADAVKRVVAGGEAIKADEKVSDPLAQAPKLPAGTGAPPANPAPGTAPTNPAQQTPPASQPAPEPTFAWRLVGISYGRKQGMALFQTEGKQLTVVKGAQLDPDTKVISVSRSHVVLEFRGKKLDLTPW